MMRLIWLALLCFISKEILASETEDKYKECLMMERSEEENPRFRRHPIVQVALHEPAYLHCIIPQFSHNLVAWTRVSDEALLTAGENSFTSDPRFQVSVKSSDSDWVLIIRRAEKSDSGCYLCEVNTEPKSTVYAVYLNVIETVVPKASHKPATDPIVYTKFFQKNRFSMAYNQMYNPTGGKMCTNCLTKRTTKLMANMVGDEVLLNCTITLSNGTSSLDDEVQWSRDGRPIDFSNSNKYISKVKRDSRTIIHTLRILGASSADDGNYACRALDAPESSHMLHVNSNAAIRCSAMLRISFLFIFLSPLLRLL